jgi:hypothetical protein
MAIRYHVQNSISFLLLILVVANDRCMIGLEQFKCRRRGAGHGHVRFCVEMYHLARTKFFGDRALVKKLISHVGY